MKTIIVLLLKVSHACWRLETWIISVLNKYVAQWVSYLKDIFSEILHNSVCDFFLRKLECVTLSSDQMSCDSAKGGIW